MVWHDEFDGSTINTARWTVRNNSYAGNELSVASSRRTNVAVGGGDLTLRAQRERYSVGLTTRDFTSGYLDTIGHQSWRYGKFEMRAKLPLSQGLWPAFWLRSDSGPAEVDIMEAVGGNPTQTTQTVHQSSEGDRGRAGHDNQFTSSTIADWHVYGVVVEPDALTWTIDGAAVFRVTSQRYAWLHGALAGAVNIRLNLQVGGALPAYYRKPVTAATVFPADFVVDWVRVYQQR